LTARDEVLGTQGTTSHQTNECVVTADLLALTPIYRRIIDRYFA
jgi:acetylornithine deacetylase/succinyl-diaminopimelate desuccinylase-like protein